MAWKFNFSTGKFDWYVTRADELSVSAIGTPTYPKLSDFLNDHHSAGYSSGGTITDNGAGAVNVSSGTGHIRTTNSGISQLYAFDWAAVSGLALTDHQTNYIYVDYGTGTPTVGAEVTKSANGRTKFYLGKVFKEGTGLHILQGGQNTTEPMKRIQGRINAVFGEIQRASGMLVSATGTLNIAVTAGVYFAGFTQVATTAKNTATGDTFEYYRLINGTWVESDATAISATQYNDVSVPGSEVLADLSNNNYGVHWIYVDVGGDLLVVYGQGNYAKLSDAEAASPPSVSYGHVADMSILVGRVIIFKGATAFTTIESAFAVDFTPSVVTDHGELAGLSDDDHTQYWLTNVARTGNFLTTGNVNCAVINATTLTLSGSSNIVGNVSAVAYYGSGENLTNVIHDCWEIQITS